MPRPGSPHAEAPGSGPRQCKLQARLGSRGSLLLCKFLNRRVPPEPPPPAAQLLAAAAEFQPGLACHGPDLQMTAPEVPQEQWTPAEVLREQQNLRCRRAVDPGVRRRLARRSDWPVDSASCRVGPAPQRLLAGIKHAAHCRLWLGCRVASRSREGLQLLRTAGAAHTGSESGADVHSKFANLNSNTSH